jgi:hypothetical protein
MSNEQKEKLVASSLGVDRFTWNREINASRYNVYYPLYRQFKDEAVIDSAILERLLSLKYARHFYTGNELKIYRRHWSAPRSGKGTEASKRKI